MKKFTLDEIVLEAMKFYEVPVPPAEGQYRTKSPGGYRKKFDNYVKATKNAEGESLWEQAIDYDYKDADRKSFHFFTEAQKNEIIHSDEIHDYMKERSNSEKIKSRGKLKDLREKVQTANQEWASFLEDNNLPFYGYTPITPSAEDFLLLELSVKIDAIFNLFFEPLDIELLNRDYTNSCLYGGNTETVESMDSKLRLKDYSNYYRKKIAD